MAYTIDNDNDNGIVKWNTGNEEYTFWTHADFIKPYIIHYLKERFPGKLIIRELNMIDLTIPEENLPIEVQATPIQTTGSPMYSGFEKYIEKQIKQNINDCDMCWFFFDSELLRAMKNASSNMSINMVWFRDHMKEGKLKVFTVSHNGIIEEKRYNDFDFLSEISQTCKIAYDTDYMILNRNKMKIFANAVKMHDFTQSEIDKFYNDWRKHCNMNIDKIDFRVFLKKQGDRAKLYGNIWYATSSLSIINDILGIKNYDPMAKFRASIIGIFDVEGSAQNVITRFVNRSNVCQYFPGYIRNKETWDKLKNHSLSPRQFESIVKNGINNYFWYEEDKDNIDVKSEQIDDKDVNVTIESKDQIITVNIKDKTKQKNIEDAWG